MDPNTRQSILQVGTFHLRKKEILGLHNKEDFFFREAGDGGGGGGGEVGIWRIVPGVSLKKSWLRPPKPCLFSFNISLNSS